jgi:hypothetical protein
MAEPAAQPAIPQAGKALNLIPVGWASPIPLSLLLGDHHRTHNYSLSEENLELTRWEKPERSCS